MPHPGTTRIRQDRSVPLLAKLRAALHGNAARLPRRSEMSCAVARIRSRSEGLTRFAEDGRLDMDTNPVKNVIRPLTSSRMNALFAGHDEGGRTCTRLASPRPSAPAA